MVPFVILPFLFMRYSLSRSISAPFVPKMSLLCISEFSLVEIIEEQRERI